MINRENLLSNRISFQIDKGILKYFFDIYQKTPENLLRIPLRTHNKFSGVYILLYHLVIPQQL